MPRPMGLERHLKPKTSAAGLIATVVAQAATYNISLDLSETGAGIDSTGTFQVPPTGGVISSLRLTLKGKVYRQSSRQ